eukprot:TRINITY_DN12226_c2_g1_i1.p1 TRINITY_DN12226_c2_g1~~TRINITY_DN12226_c2_g1_i1.p1  ORF type:complete len:179 (-),score=56.24 TRINITY_DN12226_c2_g1_i1:352-888(-)
MGGLCSCGKRNPGSVRYLPPESYSGATSSASTDLAEKKRKQEEALGLKELGNECFKKQELEKALEYYSQAILVYKYEPSLWLNRSIVNRQLEKFEAAEADAAICLELDKTNPKAAYNKALALKSMERYDEAIEAAAKGVQMNPDYEVLKTVLADVKKAKFELEKKAVLEELNGGKKAR